MLYISLGDGGSGGDPQGNGQDPSTLLGSILRIDVSGLGPDQGYRVPPDNPFVGVDGARPEIWAYGLRNPWRMAFDPATGLLWLGDVGQADFEEIDIIQGGGNYGWNLFEGTRCFTSPTCDPAGTVLPVATYGHSGGRCSVTGGYVYRGSALPGLAGAAPLSPFPPAARAGTAATTALRDKKASHSDSSGPYATGRAALSVAVALAHASERFVERYAPETGLVEIVVPMVILDAPLYEFYVDDDGRVFDFHAFRHQFISNLARSGVSPKEAQALARHSTITLTRDRYTHLSVLDIATAMERLPGLPVVQPESGN